MTSIQSSINSGILYIAVGKYSSIFLSIVIGAILARLLSPDEFGIVAIVTVFVAFFNLLSDFGLGPAVIQNDTLSDEDLKSIFTFSIVFGILLSGLFFFSSSLIAEFYKKPELISISRWLSLSILFNSLQIIPRALLQKALKFKQIGIITGSIQLISGLCAIILAYKGFSYYALVIKSIIDGFVTLIIFYLLNPVKIVTRIKILAIQKILRFSTYQFLFNFINYFSRNADNLLIGKYFGTASLGYYDKSYRLMMLPVRNLTHVITPVLMPVLSKYQNDKITIYSTYLKIVKLLATIGFPLSIFLYFSASEIINILYGPQWDQSVPVFKLLALTVGLQMVLSSTGSIFQAINRTDLLFYSGLFSSFFMLSAILIGIFIGQSLSAVATCLIIAFLMNFIQGFYILINKALGQSFMIFIRTMIFPLSISAVTAISLYLLKELSFSSDVYSLLFKITVTVTVSLIFLVNSKKNRNMFRNIIGYRKK